MVIGGGSADLPTDTTAIIDLKQPSPSFVSGPSINAPKQYLGAVILPDRTLFIADTYVNADPTAEELADIAVQAAGVAKRFGFTPRVALLASSTFGFPRSERSERIIEAVHPDDRVLSAERCGKIADGTADYCIHEVRYLSKGGGSRWVEVHARATRGPGARAGTRWS